MSPVDQAKEAAEECPNQGEDDEFGEEFEYEHPPLSPWKLLPVSLEVTPCPAPAADWTKVL